MTNISGFVTDVGMVGSHGRLIVQAVEFYGDGDEVVVPSPVSFPIAAGVVSANVSPGAARLTIHVGSSRRDWFVNVPESDVGLGDLIETFTEYEPPVVSAAIAARDAAMQARDEAVAAAGAAAEDRVQTGLDRVATGEDRQQTDLDRTAAERDRDEVRWVRDNQVFPARDAAVDAARDVAAAVAQFDVDFAADMAQFAGIRDEMNLTATTVALDANRAEAAANEFGLSVTSSTLAPGAAATVTVSGEGPAYSLAFGVPQGAKGDKGDEGEISQAQLDAAVASLVDNAPEALNTLSELSTALGDDPNFATTVSTQIGQRAKIDGAPVEYDSLGKLVTALQNHELGGSTDASLLTGALTGNVNLNEAVLMLEIPGYDPFPVPIGQGFFNLDNYVSLLIDQGTGEIVHQHPVGDLTTTGTASSTTYLRGDGSWATPTNTTYSVPTQAEAEAGTATTGRAFSAQRVRQAIDARAVTRQGSTQGLWIGTTANLPATGTAGVLYVTTE